MITLDDLMKYQQELANPQNDEVRNEIMSILKAQYMSDNTPTTKKQRSHNDSAVCQLDKDTFEVIAKFETVKAATEAIGKEKGSGISDALNGRTSTHYAYGYRWIRENELDAFVADNK